MYFMEGTDSQNKMIYHGDSAEDLEKAMDFIRKERNRRLKISDAYLLPDFVIPTAETREEWSQRMTVYRQALRDFPENVTFPNVEFPTGL